MLLTTHSPISGVSAKKNVGTVVGGGNVPAGDRVTTFPSPTGLIGSYPIMQYINSATGGGLYSGSGLVGGTLAQNDRDDVIMYYSSKTDLGGVASTAVGKPIAGPFDMPSITVTGSVVVYPSGWNWSTGQPIAAATVTGEVYGSADDAATGVGEYTIASGFINPSSGDYLPRV